MDDDDDDDDGGGRGGLERLIAQEAIDRLDLRPGAHGPPDSEWLCRVLRPLRTNRSVSSLDVWGALRGLPGGGRALAHLHAALRRPDGALCAVDVGANALGDERCAQLAGAMADGAAAGAPLQRVVLSSNALTDASAPALAALIAAGSCLQILELKSNKLGNAAAAALGKPLARNPPLTSLSLAHNSVEAKGAAALLGAMAENTTLRSLDLRNNLLGGSSGPGGRLQAQLEARCRLNEQRSTVANPVPATSVANPPPRAASRLATARPDYLEYSTGSEQPSAAGLHVSTQQAMPRRGGGSSVGAASRQHSERRAAHSWHGQRADHRAAREGSHSAEAPQDHAWKSNVDAWVEEQSGVHSDPGREEEEEEAEADSPSPRQVTPPVPSLSTLLRPYLAHFPPKIPSFARFGRGGSTSPKAGTQDQETVARGPRPENSALRPTPQMLTKGATGQRWARRMSAHRAAKPRREMSPSLDDAEQAWRDLELARHEVHERRQKLSFVSRTNIVGILSCAFQRFQR